jgi:hypothetical protein
MKIVIKIILIFSVCFNLFNCEKNKESLSLKILYSSNLIIDSLNKILEFDLEIENNTDSVITLHYFHNKFIRKKDDYFPINYRTNGIQTEILDKNLVKANYEDQRASSVFRFPDLSTFETEIEGLKKEEIKNYGSLQFFLYDYNYLIKETKLILNKKSKYKLLNCRYNIESYEIKKGNYFLELTYYTLSPEQVANSDTTFRKVMVKSSNLLPFSVVSDMSGIGF